MNFGFQISNFEFLLPQSKILPTQFLVFKFEIRNPKFEILLTHRADWILKALVECKRIAFEIEKQVSG